MSYHLTNNGTLCGVRKQRSEFNIGCDAKICFYKLYTHTSPKSMVKVRPFSASHLLPLRGREDEMAIKSTWEGRAL